MKKLFIKKILRDCFFTLVSYALLSEVDLLHYYYAEEQVKQSTRSVCADGRVKRFAAFTADLLTEAGDRYTTDSDSEDETDFEGS